MGSFGGMQDAESQKRPPFDVVIKAAGDSLSPPVDFLFTVDLAAEETDTLACHYECHTAFIAAFCRISRRVFENNDSSHHSASTNTLPIQIHHTLGGLLHHPGMQLILPVQ